ncbi:MAG: single-stranded DNA-binding protein [Nitrososphaeria archaeon]
MFTLNKMFVSGNLANDLEILKNDVAKVTLATNRYIGKNADNTEKKETTYVKIVFFNGKVNAVRNLKKGDSLGVEGYLKNASYETENGKINYYELIATDVILGNKMSNKNEVLIAGNLVETPVIKTTANGISYTKIRLAVNKVIGKNDDGTKKEETLFIDATLFGKQAEVICQYLEKGSPVFIEGVLRTRKYEKDGKKAVYTDVLVRRFQFVGTSKKTEIPIVEEVTADEDIGDDDIPF